MPYQIDGYCSLCELGHEPKRHPYAEIYNSANQPTGKFVKLPKAVVDKILEIARRTNGNTRQMD